MLTYRESRDYTEKQDLNSARPERGAILILSALIMILLLAIAAFSTDLGAWYRQGQEQQRASDVGSLNAVQAYDTGIKGYIESVGENTYSDLTTPEKFAAEVLGMQDAVDALLGTLGANGAFLSGTVAYSPDVTDPAFGTAAEVSATFDLTDGSTVVLTRNATNEIIVTITNSGAQYFSNVIRDAPVIARSSVAVISNCNADCSVEIPLVPPFQGFTGTGSGDGFRPIIGNNGRIWTVNHSGHDSVVCMDSDTQAPCAAWAPFDFDEGSWNFRTARKPQDSIDNGRDQLYFTAQERDDDEWGIACVDTVVRQWCPGKEFTKFHDTSGGYSSKAYTSGSGVFMVSDRLFAMGQDARIHCIDPDDLSTATTVECSGYPVSTSAFGQSGTPDLDYIGRSLFGEIIDGKIYFYHDSENTGGFFTCWNPANNSECWSFAVTNTTTDDRPIHFVRYSTTGAAIGLCVGKEADRDTSLTHTCVSLAGNIMSQEPNLASAINYPSGSGYVYGEGFSIDGKYTLFGSRETGHVWCYNWEDATPCGSMVGEEIYGMAQLTEDCIIGVGHSNKFTSINPRNMTQCTGTSVTTTVTPCLCADGSETRYGVLELPPALIAVLNSASATATGIHPDTGVVHTETNADLLAGPWDLSGFNGIADQVTLTIEVDSKTSGGTILWQETYNATLALTVQPTLAR